MRVVELSEAAELHELAALLGRVWRTENVIDASTLRALARTGNYVTGVYDEARLVGGAAGFFAADGHLHSHVTGVAPEYQGRGVGYALKQHQREWALARGRTTITWTFDPLQARNAYFNLTKLGARVSEYLPDFYGPLDDGVNAGDATDRLLVVWTLDALSRPVPEPTGARALLGRSGGEPVAGVREGPALTVATPDDIDALRAVDPELAMRWRMAVREALGGALAAGYRITGISRDGRYFVEGT